MFLFCFFFCFRPRSDRLLILLLFSDAPKKITFSEQRQLDLSLRFFLISSDFDRSCCYCVTFCFVLFIWFKIVRVWVGMFSATYPSFSHTKAGINIWILDVNGCCCCVIISTKLLLFCFVLLSSCNRPDGLTCYIRYWFSLITQHTRYTEIFSVLIFWLSDVFSSDHIDVKRP